MRSKILALGLGVTLWMLWSDGERERNPLEWQPAASMLEARHGLAAAELESGAILVCGGQDEQWESLATCELYDAKRNQWQPAAPMMHPRSHQRMTRLADGRVLVVGGTETIDRWMTAAEVYEPLHDRWIRVAPVPRAATSASLTALPTGDALLVGGTYLGQEAFEDSFIFAAAEGVWRAGPKLREGRSSHCAELLDGELFVIGGSGEYQPCWPSDWLCLRGGGSPQLRTVEVLTETERSRRGRHAPGRIGSCDSARLANESLFVRGAEQSAVYDSKRARWRRIPKPTCWVGRALASTAEGTTVLAGGFQCNAAPEPLATLLLEPGSSRWSWGPAVTTERSYGHMLRLADGRLVLLGGSNATGVTSTVEILTDEPLAD